MLPPQLPVFEDGALPLPEPLVEDPEPEFPLEPKGTDGEPPPPQDPLDAPIEELPEPLDPLPPEAADTPPFSGPLPFHELDPPFILIKSSPVISSA